MSNQIPTEQLLELLLQLKKAPSASARQILNERPPIAYALIALMVSMNAINVDVFQKILSDYGAAQAAQAAPAPARPHPAIPAHVQHVSQPTSRTSTPPTHNPYQHQPQSGYGQLPPNQGYGRTQPPAPAYNGGFNPAPLAGYGTPPPRAPAMPDMSAFPEEQRQMIMGLLAMTPEQINALPPADRASILQVRAQLGFPPV
ncbi:hypothetical protein B0H15DRAFT_595138 [Mycena belliarum]|uniref:Cleavage stimulation factor subunit 2 hinge domain-containing protein n=1 Tax=Mycena belliarum TaxID=1033014 RepID=A0AAD6XKC0_9AGAR|nr:hypothetical protein B0H15DRAFT_595138 [Mycena belliae]